MFNMAPPRTSWDEVATCITQLILREPYFGHLLGTVSRVIDNTTVPTAAVAIRGTKPVLIVNEEFFMKKLTKQPERVAVIKHEALHLLFKHLLRRDGRRKDPLLFNLAADIVVNQFVKAPWRLPVGAVTLESFPDLNLLPDQSLEWYYDKLKKCDESGDGGSSKGGKGQQGKQGQGQGQPGQDQDCGGSGPGGSAPMSKQIIDGMRGAGVDGSTHSDHEFWGTEEPGMEDAANTEMDRVITQAKDRAGSKGWSSLPSQIRDLITASIESRKPKVDWRRIVRIFTASSSKTRVATTMHRVSKRYGTSPGIKIKKSQRLAVIVDTSGSVSDADLSELFAEVHGVWRAGAEVVIIESDTAVGRVYKYNGRVPDKISGRGGTNFDGAFQWMRDHRGLPFDGCLYLTDGEAPAPTVKPPCKLLWVVTSNGTVGDHLLFGRAVKINS